MLNSYPRSCLSILNRFLTLALTIACCLQHYLSLFYLYLHYTLKVWLILVVILWFAILLMFPSQLNSDSCLQCLPCNYNNPSLIPIKDLCCMLSFLLSCQMKANNFILCHNVKTDRHYICVSALEIYRLVHIVVEEACSVCLYSITALHGVQLYCPNCFVRW